MSQITKLAEWRDQIADDIKALNAKLPAHPDSTRSYSFLTDQDLESWEEVGVSGGVKSLEKGRMKIVKQCWLNHTDLYPVLDDIIYKITVRYKHTEGAGRVYLGVAGIGANKVRFVNSAGTNSFGGQFYPYYNSSIDSDFKEIEMYVAADGVDLSTFGRKRNLHANAKYFRPLVLGNYNKRDGVVFIEQYKVEIYRQ